MVTLARYFSTAERRPICVAFLLGLALLSIVKVAWAQPGTAVAGFQAGDRVEVRTAGQWKMAEVLEITRAGMIKVRILDSQTTQTVPARWLRSGRDDSQPTGVDGSETAGDVRTWWDRTGVFRVDATLVEFCDGQVKLKRTDGEEITLPLARLSRADQEFVQSPSYTDPEAVLRRFLIALGTGDKETGKTLLRPNPANQILWRGETVPVKASEIIWRHFESLPLRRLQVGERVALPEQEPMIVDDSRVNADRLLIVADEWPIPFLLVRIDGQWKVDARPIIAARTAAAAAESSPPMESSPGTADQWQTVKANGGRITVSMPGKAKFEERTVPSSFGPIKFQSYKVAENGVFWNLMIVTYPPAAITANAEPIAFLSKLAEGNERQKPGSQRDELRELKESEYRAIEHRFHYPTGKTNDGAQYAAGRAIHRHYLVETSDCWQFVDINDSVYQADPDKMASRVERFFDSLKIAEQ